MPGRRGEERPVLDHGGHGVADPLVGPGADEGDDGQVEAVVVGGGRWWWGRCQCGCGGAVVVWVVAAAAVYVGEVAVNVLPLLLLGPQPLPVPLLVLLHPLVQLEGRLGHVHGICVVAQPSQGAGEVAQYGDVAARQPPPAGAEGPVPMEDRRRRRRAVHHGQVEAAVRGQLEVLGGCGDVVGPARDVAQIVEEEDAEEADVPRGEVGGDAVQHGDGDLVRLARLAVRPVVLVEEADVEQGEGREGVGLLDVGGGGPGGGTGAGGTAGGGPALLHDPAGARWLLLVLVEITSI